MNRVISQQSLHEFSKDERTNLTLEQSRLWFLKTLDPNYPDNCLVQFELIGEIEASILQLCLSDTMNHFSALRSNFVTISGKPVKKENLCSSLQFKIIDICDDSSIYEQLLKEELSYSFDYENESLIHFVLIKNDEQKYILLVK